MIESITQILRTGWENLRTIIVALLIAFFFRTFIAQPFLVSGASMERTFHDGNFLIVDEISYRFRNPERGDAIIFKYPGNEKEYFVKRIIGLPGETLTVAGNVVTISAHQGSGKEIVLREPYIQPDTRGDIHKTVTLGEEEYFVMGDNRGNSFDSRHWGPLKREEITGIVRWRVFPFSQFGGVSNPLIDAERINSEEAQPLPTP